MIASVGTPVRLQRAGDGCAAPRRRRGRAASRRGGRCSGRSCPATASAIAHRSSSRRSPGPASTTMRRPVHVQPLRQVGHHADRVRVVAVVEQHLERMLVEHVHAARAPGRRWCRRCAGPGGSRSSLMPERERHRRRDHRVLHVVQRAAFQRRRDQVRPQQRDVAALVVQRDHVAVDAGLQRAGAAAGADVLAHQRVLRVHGDVADHLGVGVARHLQHVADRRR